MREAHIWQGIPMHRANALASAVAYVTGTPREHVRYRARGLVESGVWPHSRGGGAPPLSALDAATLMFVIAFAERGSDLRELALDFAFLPLAAGDGPSEDGRLLGPTLARLLQPDCREHVRLRLYRHAGGENAAEVILEGEDREKPVLWPFWREPQWSGWTRRSWELSPEGFEFLRNLLARDDLDKLELKRL
jgi:hypothetical protein